MAYTKRIQFRRGTSTDHSSFIGAEGEITVNTTNKSLHVHDGLTSNGFELLKTNFSNSVGGTINGNTTINGDLTLNSSLNINNSCTGGTESVITCSSGNLILQSIMVDCGEYWL